MGDGRQETILLVARGRPTALDRKAVLERHGYRVAVAADGKEAIRLALAEPAPDLALVDFELDGGMDGVEAARAILEARELPVLFMSNCSAGEIPRPSEGPPASGFAATDFGEGPFIASVRLALLSAPCAGNRRRRDRREIAAEEELILAQRAIADGEARYRTLLDSMNDGLCLHELVYGDSGEAVDYRILDVNLRFEDILGMARDKAIGRLSTELYGTGSPPFLDLYARVAETGRHESFETYFPPMDKHFLISVFSPGKGKFATVFQDISARKKAEEALRESEERHRRLFETSMQGIVYQAADDSILMANRSAERILGMSADQLTGRTSMDPAWKAVREDGSDLPGSEHPTMVAMRTGRPVGPFIMGVHSPGRAGVVWISVTATPVFHHGEDRPYQVYATFDDVTERRARDVEKKLNEARMESLLRINEYDARDTQAFLDFALAEIVSLTGSKIGYLYFYDDEKRQFILNSWSKDVMPQCSVANPRQVYDLDATGIWGEAVRQARPIVLNDFSAANPLKKGLPAGHVGLDRFLTIPVFGEGRIVAVVGVGNKRDEYDGADIRQLKLMMDAVWKIVQRRDANERIKALLAEKELLLRETHHRIKNNMGVVYNMLSLQAASQENDGLRSVLDDAALRVRSMGILYDSLYRSNAHGEPRMALYLPPLVKEIVGVFNANPPVGLSLLIDDFTIAEKTITPLGIIINELVTNSMKYAFGGTGDRLISLAARKEGNAVTLEYRDNGPGLPDRILSGGFTGFGMQLIGMLVEQIGGTMALSNDGGAKVVIVFSPSGVA